MCAVVDPELIVLGAADTFRAAARAELVDARPVESPRGGTAFKLPLVTATLLATLRDLTAATVPTTREDPA